MYENVEALEHMVAKMIKKKERQNLLEQGLAPAVKRRDLQNHERTRMQNSFYAVME